VTAPGSAPGRVCAPRANPRRRPPRTRPPQPSAHNGCVRHAPSQFVRGVQIGKVACCMRHAGRQDACSARRGRGGAVLLAFRDLEQRDGTRRGQRARGVRRGRAPRAPGPHAVRQPRSRAPPAPRARARPGGGRCVAGLWSPRVTPRRGRGGRRGGVGRVRAAGPHAARERREARCGRWRRRCAAACVSLCAAQSVPAGARVGRTRARERAAVVEPPARGGGGGGGGGGSGGSGSELPRRPRAGLQPRSARTAQHACKA